MGKIIGIGETILDIIFQDGQPQKAVPGGSTFNCMVSLSRCGVQAEFVSEIGNDRVGGLIRSFMSENGLSTRFVHLFEDGSSPVAMAFLDKEKNASYQFYLDYPTERLNVVFPEIRSGDAVIFGSYFAVNPLLRSRVKEFLTYAKEQGAFIYYDINFRKAHQAERDNLMTAFKENFAYASLVRCSDEDLQVLFPDSSVDEVYAREIMPHCPNLIVTQGGRGVLLKTPSFDTYFPVREILPISTIGAGDNFNAGFLYEWITRPNDLNLMPEDDWHPYMSRATAFASEVCGSLDNYVGWEFARQQ